MPVGTSRTSRNRGRRAQDLDSPPPIVSRLTRTTTPVHAPLTTGRSARYNQLPGLDRFHKANISIAGCGAVGRPLALTLAQMGASHIFLYDHDKVDESNLGTQGWNLTDLSQPKVQALFSQCFNANPDCEVEPIEGKYPHASRINIPDVLFVCVDTMAARNDIYSWLIKSLWGDRAAHSHRMVIDTRMGLYSGHIIRDRPLYKLWKSTLFKDEEASDAPCGLQATRFASSVVANWAVSIMMQAFASLDGPTPLEVRLDLLANTCCEVGGTLDNPT